MCEVPLRMLHQTRLTKWIIQSAIPMSMHMTSNTNCMMHNLEWTLTSHPKHRSKLASNKVAISFEDFSLWIWVKTWACKELSGSWAISAVSGLASWLAGTSMIQYIYPQTLGDSQDVKSIIIESCDIFFCDHISEKLVVWALKFERGGT